MRVWNRETVSVIARAGSCGRAAIYRPLACSFAGCISTSLPFTAKSQMLPSGFLHTPSMLVSSVQRIRRRNLRLLPHRSRIPAYPHQQGVHAREHGQPERAVLFDGLIHRVGNRLRNQEADLTTCPNSLTSFAALRH